MASGFWGLFPSQVSSQRRYGPIWSRLAFDLDKEKDNKKVNTFRTERQNTEKSNKMENGPWEDILVKQIIESIRNQAGNCKGSATTLNNLMKKVDWLKYWENSWVPIFYIISSDCS